MFASRFTRILGLVSAGLLLGAVSATSASAASGRGVVEGPPGAPPLAPGNVTAPAAASAGVSAGCTAAPNGINFHAPAFGSGKTVALTFDDGPGRNTLAVVTVLRAYGVTATFFNIGRNAASYPSLARAEATDGYLVGNHTWDHPSMPRLSAAAQAAELDEATAEQEKLTGWGPCAFRPPYGNYNATTLALAQQHGMKAWYWSVDTEDWKAAGSAAASWVNRIISLAESQGGSQRHPVVLMHNAPSGNPATLAALPTIIKYFRDRGYTFVNLAGDTGTGYYELASSGMVRGYAAPAPGRGAAGPAVGLATDPDTGGYWLLKANGSVIAHDAPYYGQASGSLGRQVQAVAIAASRGGYLVLTSDGQVHAFGAPYHGAPAGKLGTSTPVGIAADAATGGYWIVNSAGGVWNYGAPWYGSRANRKYRVTAITASPEGGYLLLTSTGAVGVYHAGYHGGVKGPLGRGVSAVALAIAPATGGYWITLSDGRVLAFGAPAHGSLAGALPGGATATAIAGV